MTHDDLVAAVEAHPTTPAYTSMGERSKSYDLREIALHLLERDTAERSMDWWNAALRDNGRGEVRPIYFLSFELELCAYRLIVQAAQGKVLESAHRIEGRDEYAAYVRAGTP